MSDSITITGIVATDPKHVVTNAGLAITSFRLASPQRRFDRAKGEWIDGDTNWYTVTAFRRLATNCIGSLAKGQRVLVAGRLRIRDWSHEGRTGTSTEIDADAIGHDLSWGTASFARTISAASAGGSADADADADGVAPAAVAAGVGIAHDPTADVASAWRAPGEPVGEPHDDDADGGSAPDAADASSDAAAGDAGGGSAAERRALAGVSF
jgi:single-strand DNA-binding protein